LFASRRRVGLAALFSGMVPWACEKDRLGPQMAPRVYEMGRSVYERVLRACGMAFGPTRRAARPPRWSTRSTGRAARPTRWAARSTRGSLGPTRRTARSTGRAFRASTTGRVFVGRLCRFLIGRPHFLLCSAVRTEVGRFIGKLYPTIRTEVSRFIDKLYPTTRTEVSRFIDKLCSAVRTEVSRFIGKLCAAIQTEVSRFIDKLYPAVGAKPLFFYIPSGSSTLLFYPLALLF